MASKNPAVSTSANDTVAPVSFLAQLTSLATPIVDLSVLVTKRDPLIAARTKFAANCDDAIKAVKSAADTSKFLRKLPDGYLINFRNGNRSMELNGAAYFKVGDAEAAVALIEAAKAASDAGELDAAFKASARAPKKEKAST